MKALITGVNSLVNKALLEKLLNMGYEVTSHYHTDNEITKELKEKFPKVRFIQADFSNKDGFLDFVNKVMDTKYDVLVNACVYYAETKDWKVQQDWDTWQKSFAINTTTAGVLMAHGDMTMNKGGVIINISSTYSQTHMTEMNFLIYSATKSALNSLTAGYAKRWAKENIRVVGIAPGYIESAWNKGMSEEVKKDTLNDVHTSEWIKPSEIADLMVSLINNKSINATTIVIDGGLSAPII